jgi:hypothetical protein
MCSNTFLLRFFFDPNIVCTYDLLRFLYVKLFLKKVWVFFPNETRALKICTACLCSGS